MSSATTIEEARWLERNGADIVIAQGLEAGGHRGHFLGNDVLDISAQMGTSALFTANHARCECACGGCWWHR